MILFQKYVHAQRHKLSTKQNDLTKVPVSYTAKKPQQTKYVKMFKDMSDHLAYKTDYGFINI